MSKTIKLSVRIPLSAAVELALFYQSIGSKPRSKTDLINRALEDYALLLESKGLVKAQPNATEDDLLRILRGTLSVVEIIQKAEKTSSEIETMLEESPPSDSKA